MNMEQINMMMQLMMQRGQVSGSGAGKDSNGDSFQDMMSQKQEAVSSNKTNSNNQQTQSKPTQNDKVQQTVQTPQENVTEVSDDVRQALTAMLFQPYVVQDVAVQQPAQENVDNMVVSAMPTVDAAVTQTVQTAVAAETTVPTAQPTVQVPQQMAAEQAQPTSEVVVPQEGVQQQGLQDAASHTEQQPTADTAAGQKLVEANQQDDQPVVMTQQEQPLVRDVETVPVKVGEATPTVDVNAPDMEKQLADTIKANLSTVGDKVRIQLQPENLGHITIELAQHAGNLGALLEDRTGQTVHIQVQQQEPEQPQYDGHNQQNRQQQEQQSHPQQSKAEQDSFLGQLRLGLYQLDTI